MTKPPRSNSVLRSLPSVDEVLRSEVGRTLVAKAGHAHTSRLARESIESLRKDVATDPANHSKQDLLNAAADRLAAIWHRAAKRDLQKVINCTGVVIHTNLGRAPLAAEAQQAIIEQAAAYCNLEYDIENGRRGKRAPQCEEILTELTGAEAALIVNNCAAAAYFILTVFADGGDVAVSRGELVEIGGDFRVPDVLSESGATLYEVGTTNRTKLADYKQALEDGARMILRVHPSNYRIIGFTATPSLGELAELAHNRDVILYEDIGSGALVDLSPYGITDEPMVADSIAAGADIVTFSGDKLLGGPQAGIILGRRQFIDRLRRHPLYRALRVDKLIYAGLEATLSAYRRGDATAVPVIRMLSLNSREVQRRAKAFLSGYSGPLHAEIIDGASAVGGGAAPAAALETSLIALTHSRLSAEELEQRLRSSDPPVIARIENDKVLLDLRTVDPDDEPVLMQTLRSID